MAEQIPLSSDDSPKNQPQSGVKKEPKQQQQQQQQHKQQQKGRVDLKGVISSQTGRPTATGSAGQHSKNENDKGQKSQHPKNEQKPQVNPAGVKGQQTTKASVVMPARLSLFDHLPRKQSVANPFSIEGDASLHPATIKLGLLYRKGSVQSDDDRIVALLATFLNVIKDYKTPPNKNLSWDLDRHIRTQVQYLVDCRQLSMGMGNLIKYIRYEISHIAPELSEADAKAYLIEKLTIFLEERVVYARELITMCCVNTIKDDDVILTFGSSALIRQILLKAAVTKRFRLIVVDTRPLNEGLLTLAALSPYVRCVHTPLAGAAAIMREATRVLLGIGASALLSNGSMLAPAGTAMVASIAKALRVPVIVASESYKFCEKVQLDSIVYNELGASTEIASVRLSYGEGVGELGQSLLGGGVPIPNDPNSDPTPQYLSGYRGATDGSEGGLPFRVINLRYDLTPISGLPFQVINLRYDLTPIGNISVIATETGLIPPTSIPVLIRELRTDLGANADPEGLQ